MAQGKHMRNRHRQAGLSLVEMLISLAIIAMLLTATMVAIDASFKAYAAAAESASTQTATRLVVHRLLTLVRTSTAHGPLDTSDLTADDPPVTFDGDDITSPFIVLRDQHGQLICLEYREEEQRLYLIENPYSSDPEAQPLLGGVTECTFYIRRRMNRNGIFVLQRGSLELRVEPDKDNTLAIEAADTPAIEVVASTMPRRLE